MKKLIIIGFFTSLFLQVYAQEPNDCVNAITVCGNGSFQSNATGMGNLQEISSCGGLEGNSLWLKVNIVQSGTLGFDLIPNDPSILVDYDFWVFGPNRVCSNLGNPIRCATTNPNEAGLATNHTGINGSTTLTQTGPGSLGTGYVFWLNVVAGQSYYIAIDRPVGEGGFQIQWTGTATAGTGAFPAPPTANAIDDVKQCSSNPNIAIFDLNSIKSSINSDPGNTIDFFETLADATDGVNPLPGIYANTSNPQLIYAKVTSNGTDCYTLIDFNLRVTEIPDATVSATSTSICEGESVTFTITGTPFATVHYTLDGGTTQAIDLDATGVFDIQQTPTSDLTINVVDAQVINGATVVCSQAVGESITVMVTASITPTFTQVAPICTTGSLSPLPTTSNNGITGSWSPAMDSTTTTTYTFTPDAGQCATTQTMEIIVGSSTTPIFTQVAPICNGETLAPLPTTSNNGVDGAWSPAINNTATTTYTFTPIAGQCVNTQTMQIIVNPATAPTFTQVDPICSGETIAPLPTNSNNGIIGTWSPAIDNSTTTTYTFTPDAGQCASTQTMQIMVTPSVTPLFTQVASICSGGSLAPLPTTSNNGISGTWSPEINNTATTTYTFTPDASGACTTTQAMEIVVNTSTTPNFVQPAPICSGDMLSALPTTSDNGIAGSWSPALNNTATTTYTFTPNAGQCAATQSMEIVVNPMATPLFTQVAPICSGDNLSPLPTTSNNGVMGIWAPAINNTTTTTYTFMPNSGECATTATMEITVNPSVTPIFTQIAPICNEDTLSALPTTSNNGITGTWSPAINNTATTLYTFTPTSGQCAPIQTMEIIVNPTPTIAVDELTVCSATGNGFYAFNLNAEVLNILGSTQNSNTFTVSFYEDAATNNQITGNPYTNTTAFNQTIFVVITNTVGGCFGVFPYELNVESQATATMPAPVAICDTDGINDGFNTFDLTILDTEVLNGQDPNNFTVSYYLSNQNALDGSNPITDPMNFQNTTPDTQTVYIRVINNNIPAECFATTSTVLTIYPVLTPTITALDGLNTICVDFETNELQNEVTLLSDLQNINYIYTWYLNGSEIPNANQATYTVNTVAPGLYTVEVTEIQSISNCTSNLSEPFEVIQSGQAVFVEVQQSNAFDSPQTITVVVQGYGDYWFQLDDGEILDNGGVFTNVGGGLHDVYVYDYKTETSSCGFIVIENIRVIAYPKFLTPNDDGYHDTWNVFALNDQPLADITIYNRFGNILGKLKTNGPGWDGTFEGENLPSTDYWFELIYEEFGQQKVFRSHFALKR